MSERIVAAAVQLAAHDRDSFRGAWPEVARRIREAASNGARLIVTPEGTLPAYVLGYDRFDPAEIAAALRECRELARETKTVIVAGAARQDGDATFNSAVVIDADGSIAGAADKHFLWHFDRQWFAAGDRLEPIRTSLGSIGALICADGRIPTIARKLVDGGADVLVMPTAWVTSGRDPENLENVQADLLARVRARENGVAFVAANKCGVEQRCVAYCGKSQIIEPDGTIAALAPQHEAQTIFAEIPLGAAPRSSRLRAPERLQSGRRTPLRVALSAREADSRTPDRLRILEADLAIAPRADREAIRAAMDCAFVGDEVMTDPAGLAAYRRAGYDVAVWQTEYETPWQERFARTRAVELRMYVAVIDDARGRAYAVDPDGTIACGTFGAYETASFTYDPARTLQTAVAPGTDVLKGLERAAIH